MSGVRRLTWVTALTLAGTLLAATVVSAMAAEGQGRGRGHARGPDAAGAAAQRSDDHPGRGLGVGRARHAEQMTEDDEDEDVGAALVTGPGRPTGAGRPDHGKPECPEDLDDESFTWRNHGHYVSCVAREGEPDEGETHGEMVSEAAQSDIGKPEHDEGEGEEDDG